MELSEFEFFRDATLQICSSLDIEKALFNYLQHVRSFIPASHVAMALFDPGSRNLVKMLVIDHLGAKTSLPPVPMSRESAANLASNAASGGISIIDKLEEYSVAKDLRPYVDFSNHSAMIMNLGIEGKHLGAFILLAKGSAVFTKDHAELASLLRGPFSIAMSNALRYEELEKLKDLVFAENRELSRQLRRRFAGGEIIGAEFGLGKVMERVRRVAPLDSPVILLGETGVGKEVIANAIHATSSRKDGPLVAVNCGAIPENLLDSELFGHERGAFTGAIAQKRGYFERADGGTVFLDEIGELPPQAQVRLLRVLQQKTIERVGGTKTISVDVRILAATHRDMQEQVRSGAFREDLWFRLNVFPIVIPPLRDRKEDIPALAHYFLEKKSKELKIYPQSSIPVETVERLKSYHWPGNIRELENLIERELINNRGRGNSGRLQFEDFQIERKTEEAVADLDGSESLTIDQVVSRHIRRTLQTTHGRISGSRGAAQLLGVNPHTLRSRMQKLGIPFKYSQSDG
ncbi:MAG: sigma 54-interacting transcriptional regulator [Syntrophobacteraceae bacterium]|nr:sigma 54-interacting transcriptional regulator [Syntrophobacteraceae bacterium]